MSQTNTHQNNLQKNQHGIRSENGDSPQLSTPNLSADQIKHQMELIMDSKHFRQAKSLEKFLRYVVARKLDGAENELKEYTVGYDVFQRGQDFDPRRDAVVRVQANLLRKRLANYYREEGAQDEIVIELPKGHYVPQFYHRQLSAEPIKFASSPVVATTGKPAPNTASMPHFPSTSPWFIAITFILGLLTAFAFQHWQDKRVLTEMNDQTAEAGSQIDPVYQTLWGKFLEPGAENLLAYGAPQFFVANGVFLRDVEINSPRDVNNGSRLMSLRKASRLDFKPTEVYTGVGETHGVYLLTRFFNKAVRELRVTRSRMVGWNEMKNANVIFLSSMRFQTLAQELPYPSDFVIHPGITSKVINLRPGAGEPATYGGNNNGDYAVLTVWPGKLHQRRIMILSGSTTWATMAAAEYVTDPEYLRQLNQHLDQCRVKVNAAQHAPYFQVLLRAQVKDNQPVSISFVTHHDLQIAGPIDEPINTHAERQVAMRRR